MRSCVPFQTFDSKIISDLLGFGDLSFENNMPYSILVMRIKVHLNYKVEFLLQPEHSEEKATEEESLQLYLDSKVLPPESSHFYHEKLNGHCQDFK